MPAPKIKYYSTKDIMDALSVSRSYALKLMHMFEQEGSTIRLERGMLRVKAVAFEAYLKEIGG